MRLGSGYAGRFGESFRYCAHAADPLWPPVYLTEAYLAAFGRDNGRALAAARNLLDFKPD